jgi:DNA (cytosine-5)-methyltransferase 1
MGEEGTYNALRAADGSSSRQPLVAYRRATTTHNDGDPDRWEETEVSGTVAAHSTVQRTAIVETPLTVRRLTPTECERLQGFPDGHTAWGVDVSGQRVNQADSARYRQTGNAVSVPVAEWIGRRLVAADGAFGGEE